MIFPFFHFLSFQNDQLFIITVNWLQFPNHFMLNTSFMVANSADPDDYVASLLFFFSRKGNFCHF